jgi:hypothetical protein
MPSNSPATYGPVKRTETKDLTYLGRRARTTTNYYQSNRTGLREIVTEYIDDADERNGGWPAGTITRRVVKGDGRHPDFQTIEHEQEY